jgi:transcription termination/antitermination protein NusA
VAKAKAAVEPVQEVTLNTILDQVSKDKGIEKSVLVSTLEEAILAAARKAFGADRALEAHFNEEKGLVEVTQTIRVVADLQDPVNEISLEEAARRNIEAEDGDELVFQIYYRDEDGQEAREQDELYGDILKLKTYRRSFGRVAAQTAKQVILQRVRDVERDTVFVEYKDRKGELIRGIARRFERGNIIVDLGRVEAVVPPREQVPREMYRAGDSIQAYVIDIQRHTKGPQIILSRTNPGMLMKLFELEVPEIAEGIVKIEAAAREPGSRAKIAVSSRDRDVDPVGACVGMKGSRVQAVVQELRGEKIDIIPWDEDTARFVCNALAPAEVSRVLIDESAHTMEIIVPDDQLSLAIGRRGQNVRLAAQLTGWRLDIHSESKIKDIKEKAWASLSKVDGCNEFVLQTLYNHGIRSARALSQEERSSLLQIPGITEELVERMLSTAKVVAAEEEERDKHLKSEAEIADRRARTGKQLQNLLGTDEHKRLLGMRGMTESVLALFKAGGYETVESIAQESDLVAMGEKVTIGERRAKQYKHAASVRLREENLIRDDAKALGIEIGPDNMVIVPGLNDENDPNSSASAEPTPVV